MKDIFFIIIIILLILLVIGIFVNQIIGKKGIIKLFGFGILYVTSGSMYPTIETGELIIIKESNFYEVNDIVTYNIDNQILVTHRIVEIQRGDYIMKGDYNNVKDEEKINKDQIEGKMIFHSKILGNIYKNRLLIIFIIVFILFLSMISISTAKYIQKFSFNASGIIAKPIVDIKGEETLNITLANQKQSYVFDVVNYNEKEQLNEVELEYEIQISPDNKNIVYELFYEGEEVELINNKTQKKNIGNNQKENHQYQLDIEYIGEQVDFEENIEVKVKFIQKNKG